MTDIIRSWACQNSRCNKEFTAWESHPACPSCGNVRVQWIPGGGHVAGTAKAADAELRHLADVFKMTNINSAERDQRARPKLPSQPNPGRDAPNMQFAPGFTAPVNPSAAQCLPSTSNVNFKARVAQGRALSASRSVPGVHSATTIEARHTPTR